MANYFLLCLNIITLILVGLIFFKLRNSHLLIYDVRDKVKSSENNIIKQVESLLGLYVELDFKKSLPFTRGWAASPDFLLTIAKYALEKKPNVIFECSSGVSTVVLAQCVKKNGIGHVYSLDNDEKYAEKTRENLKSHGLSDYATVITSPLHTYELSKGKFLWYSLSHIPIAIAIDMLVIDGPPASVGAFARYPAGPLLFEKLKKGSIVILDDTFREDEKNIVEKWIDEFHFFVKNSIDCEKGCIVLEYK